MKKKTLRKGTWPLSVPCDLLDDLKNDQAERKEGELLFLGSVVLNQEDLGSEERITTQISSFEFEALTKSSQVQGLRPSISSTGSQETLGPVHLLQRQDEIHNP